MPDKHILKATEPSILRIGFDPEQIAKLHPTQVDDIAYHLARILRGEGSAASEWEHVGLRVSLTPWSGQ